MGIEVVKGNPVQDLQQQDIIYLSESLAKQMFADEDPIGKVVNSNKSYDLTVKGIYKDIPDNSTLQPAAVVSLPTLLNRWDGGYSWNGGDSWLAYLRVKPGTDLENLNVRIAKAIKEQLPPNDDFAITCMLKPIRDTYRNYEHVQLITLILSVLGASILFITALNYVLISIASLSRRAKAVGIHKCSGAQTSTIFGMFLLETGIIIIFALLLMTFLVFNFQEFVEETASTKLANLFAWQRIWVPACVTLVLFLVGAVIPGIVFSNIPVTQVFKKYTEGKKSWKRTLLFVQFAGVAFIGGLIALISIQYNHVINKDVGYNPVRMAYGGHSLRNVEEYDINYSFYHSLPYVDAIATSHDNPIDGYSGEFIRDENGKELFEEFKDGFLDFKSDPKKWGKDLIDNFIGGIKDGWKNLKNSVTDVAQSIKDLIGFSEPKEGPLSNFHTYAPDMMDLFAQGVRENEHVVTDQIEKSFDFGKRTIEAAYTVTGDAAYSGHTVSGSYSPSVVININGADHIDARTLAQEAAEAVSRALQNMTERRAAVYG